MLDFIRRKSSNIFVPKATAIKVVGSVRGHQTWLDEHGRDSGEIVPGSQLEDKNTIEDALKAYLAYKIGTDTTDYALNNLFTADEATPFGTMAGLDGIVIYDAVPGDWNTFITTLNDGGDNTETYIEYYGYHTNSGGSAESLVSELRLLHSLNSSEIVFASYTIGTTLADGRRYHFYWKISFA